MKTLRKIDGTVIELSQSTVNFLKNAFKSKKVMSVVDEIDYMNEIEDADRAEKKLMQLNAMHTELESVHGFCKSDADIFEIGIFEDSTIFN